MTRVFAADGIADLDDFTGPYTSCVHRDFEDREDAEKFERVMRDLGFDTLVWTWTRREGSDG